MKVWVWKDNRDEISVNPKKPIEASCGRQCCGFSSPGSIPLCGAGMRVFKGVRRYADPKQYEVTAKEVK